VLNCIWFNYAPLFDPALLFFGEKMARTKYEVIEIENAEITVDVSMLLKEDSMFFNATEMAKSFGKEPHDFLRGEVGKEYLNAFLDVSNEENSNTEISRITMEDIVKTKRGNKYGGTWLHNDIVLQFARWLSAHFAVRLDKWIIKRLKEEEERRRDRLAAKTGYLELSEAVMNDHDPAKGYHYSNEANMINRIVLGMDAKKFKEAHGVENLRDSLDAFQIKSIEKLQKMNTSLIDLEVEYQDRKDKLSKFYNEKMLLPE